METIKFRGLRSSFILYVLTTLVVVAILSGLTIWGCVTLQKTLLPDSNLVYLTTVSYTHLTLPTNREV